MLHLLTHFTSIDSIDLYRINRDECIAASKTCSILVYVVGSQTSVFSSTVAESMYNQLFCASTCTGILCSPLDECIISGYWMSKVCDLLRRPCTLQASAAVSIISEAQAGYLESLVLQSYCHIFVGEVETAKELLLKAIRLEPNHILSRQAYTQIRDVGALLKRAVQQIDGLASRCAIELPNCEHGSDICLASHG